MGMGYSGTGAACSMKNELGRPISDVGKSGRTMTSQQSQKEYRSIARPSSKGGKTSAERASARPSSPESRHVQPKHQRREGRSLLQARALRRDLELQRERRNLYARLRCSGLTYLCKAEEGYDAPTGWGAPDRPLETPAGYHAVVTPPTVSATTNSATLTGYINPEAGLTLEELGSLVTFETTRLYGVSCLATPVACTPLAIRNFSRRKVESPVSSLRQRASHCRTPKPKQQQAPQEPEQR